ncbi:DUF6009 family protein [Streptomyces sp. NPDC087859]|uniref:DUF6009 family protein n=1 Tax=Streptomyces sp. NPDC087859 TaxID=3365812 RepID=UPI0038247AD5
MKPRSYVPQPDRLVDSAERFLPHDRDSDSTGDYQVGAPGEAVDPSTIEPRKVARRRPARKWGRMAQIAPAGS